MKALTGAMALLACATSSLAQQDQTVTGEDVPEYMDRIGAAMHGSESHTTAVMSPNPERVWALDIGFAPVSGGAAFQAAKAYAIDTKTGEMEGMFSSGYLPNLGLSPDGSEIYSLDTFYTKHTRGERHDYLTIRDALTLDIKAEIELPKGRLLVVSKKTAFDVTTDGRFGLSFNLAPATSASVVDIAAQEYAGEIPLPGCGLVFATDVSKFGSLCSDGTILTTAFSFDDGVLDYDQTRTEVVFDVVDDPIFEHAAVDRSGQKAHFVTYSGKLLSVDFSGDTASVISDWQFNADVAGWVPGGWQLAAYHAPSGHAYVLMHEGGQWTHKHGGTELWELDPIAQSVVKRIPLEDVAVGVSVTQTDEPRIYTNGESTDILFYNADGDLTGRIDALGDFSILMYAPGDY